MGSRYARVNIRLRRFSLFLHGLLLPLVNLRIPCLPRPREANEKRSLTCPSMQLIIFADDSDNRFFFYDTLIISSSLTTVMNPMFGFDDDLLFQLIVMRIRNGFECFIVPDFVLAFFSCVVIASYMCASGLVRFFLFAHMLSPYDCNIQMMKWQHQQSDQHLFVLYLISFASLWCLRG